MVLSPSAQTAASSTAMPAPMSGEIIEAPRTSPAAAFGQLSRPWAHRLDQPLCLQRFRKSLLELLLVVDFLLGFVGFLFGWVVIFGHGTPQRIVRKM
jgi:hypothetical protein